MEREIEYTVKNEKRKCLIFDKIETPDHAYLIGFLSMDGSFIAGKRNDKKYSKFAINNTNISLIKFFHLKYCPFAKLTIRDPRSSNKVTAINKTAEFIFPTPMFTIFKKFGIADYKINRKMIGIPKRFFWSYIHGVMDADGCFVVKYRKDCRTPRLNIHIVSSAEKILSEIQRQLTTEYNISSSVYQRKDQAVFELRINNTEHSILFGQNMYLNTPEYYDFKKNKVFINYIESLR